MGRAVVRAKVGISFPLGPFALGATPTTRKGPVGGRWVVCDLIGCNLSYEVGTPGGRKQGANDLLKI